MSRARRLLTPLAAAALLLAAAPPASAAAPLHPLPLEDVTPRDARDVYCPADLGAADAAAYLRVGSFAERELRVDVAVTSLLPGARGPLQALPGGGGCPVAATLPDGSALLAFSRGGLMSDEGPIVASSRPAGDSAFGALQRIGRGVTATRPAVALAAGGDAVVTWLETVERAGGGGEALPHAALRAGTGGRFSAPVALGPSVAHPDDLGTLLAASPQVGIDAAGNVIAVWLGPGRAPGRGRLLAEHVVWAAQRPAGGAFGSPRELARLDSPEPPRLAVAPTGEAVLAITGEDGLRLATGTAAGGLSALTRVAEVASQATVAIAPGGAAVVGWADARPDRAGSLHGRFVAVGRAAGGAPFGAPRRLAAIRGTNQERYAATLDLAIAGDGRTLATWTDAVRLPDRLDADAAHAAHGVAGGGWQPPIRVGSPCRALTQTPRAAFGADGRPRVTLVDGNLLDGGDGAWPIDSRIRVARFGEQPSADVTPPRATLTARRRQVLRDDLRRSGEIRARVRCREDCDAHVFAIVAGRRALGSGLFPQHLRLRAGRSAVVRLGRSAGFFDETDGAYRARRTTRIRVVAHVCDAAGNVGRADARVDAWVPRFTRGGW